MTEYCRCNNQELRTETNPFELKVTFLCINDVHKCSTRGGVYG